MKKKNNILKKIGMGILSTLLSISILGINAKALDKITVGGAVDSYTNFSTAWMINCTGHNAYSEVFLRQVSYDNAAAFFLLYRFCYGFNQFVHIY